MLNLPNFLTLVRILTIPAFLILLMYGYPGIALLVFVAGGVTDALDGAIARFTDTKTELGAILDPLADKLLLLSSFSVLAVMGQVPNWLTVIVIMRDVVLLSGYFTLFVVSGERMAVRPSAIGKATTFFQLLSVTTVLLDGVWPNAISETFQDMLFVVTGAATGISGIQYVLRGLTWLQQPSHAGTIADEAARRRSG